MYKRKTEDEFQIQGYYGHTYGWEYLTTEESYKDAKTQLRCYNENENTPHRIIKKRVRKEVNNE